MADKTKVKAGPTTQEASTGCVFCDLEVKAEFVDGAWVHVTKKGVVACNNPEQMQQEPPAAPAPASPRAGLTESALPVAPAVSADEPVAVAAIERPGLENPEAYAAAVEEIRQRRKIFGASAQKLALPERRGYHRHWFNDSPGRVEEALNNGWGHVLGQDRKPVRRIVGTGRDGGPLAAYAMELPQILWDEDQAAKNKAAQARLDQVKGAGAFRAAQGTMKRTDEGKFYSPSEEPVTVSESLGR